MKAIVKYSEVKGVVQAPPSKSLMQRAVALSLLSNKTTRITNSGYCIDSLSAIKIAENMGAEITIDNNAIVIKGKLKLKSNIIDCRESGLCMRMFSVIASLFSSPITITGNGSLLERPVNMIETPLKELGVKCTTNNGFLPIIVCGPIKAGTTTVDGSISSQFITGLLITLPLLNGDSEIILNNATSKPYIDLTIQSIKDFGVDIENNNYQSFKIKGNQKYCRKVYNIEGDWSSASFLFVAGAIAGKVNITGLNINSKQADIKILEVLQKAGADVIINKNDIEVKKNKLTQFGFNATECPDLIPPIIALAANCKGKSVIKGATRLIHKESNRAEILKEVFAKLGIKIIIQDDLLIVTGGEIKSSKINPHNDHRIAMAATIAAITSKEPVIINDIECINKSYPDFFNDIQKIGIMIN